MHLLAFLFKGRDKRRLILPLTNFVMKFGLKGLGQINVAFMHKKLVSVPLTQYKKLLYWVGMKQLAGFFCKGSNISTLYASNFCSGDF